MIYPNIFEFASKELTQDAMVCWILKCAEQPAHNIGRDFVKMIIPEADYNFTFKSPVEKQYHRIDVYTCIESKGKLYPIIFEDKVNTTLHDNQLERYCSEVRKWFYGNERCDKITYVYFKTGYMFASEKAYIENKIAEQNCKDEKQIDVIFITIDKMINITLPYINDCELIKQYHEYLKDLKSRQEELKENWSSTEPINESLLCHIGQGIFLENAFGKDIYCSLKFSGKTEYACYEMCHLEDSVNTKRIYSIVFRFEPRWKRISKKNDKNEIWHTGTYLQMQLYRNDALYDSNDTWYDDIYDLCKKIEDNIKSDDVICEFESKHKKKRQYDYDGAEIFRITFNKDGRNTPEKTARFINAFKAEFIKYKEELPLADMYIVKIQH